MRLALRLPLAKLPPPRRWRWRLSDRTGSPSGGQAALGRLDAFSVAPLQQATKLEGQLSLHELWQRDSGAIRPVVAALPELRRPKRVGAYERRRQRAGPVSEQLRLHQGAWRSPGPPYRNGIPFGHETALLSS
jgi:hypothetical protein